MAGLDIASFGAWEDAGAEPIEGRRESTHSYRKYLLHDGKITGAIYIGESSETWEGNELGMVKGLVQSGVVLGDWKDYLAARPFDVKKPYLACGTVSALLPDTVLGEGSRSPR